MSIKIENKDWNRMYDLIVDGKDGAGVARSIKQKDKAIARYTAALRLLRMSPAVTYSYDDNQFHGHFCDFGNKALELGSSYEEIFDVWKDCPEPTSLIEKISDYLGAVESRVKIPDNFFKELRHAGIPITTSVPDRKPQFGYHSIPLEIRFYPDTYDEFSLEMDVEVSDNEPNTYYICTQNGIELSGSLQKPLGYNQMREVIFNAVKALGYGDKLNI